MLSEQEAFRRRFLLFLALAVTAIFLYMIRGFLIALVLGAVFAGLAHPIYSWMLRRMGNRKTLASISTLLVLLLAIGLPLAAFLGLVAANAFEIGQIAVPWAQKNIAQPTLLEQRLLERVPLLAHLEPYRESIVSSLGRVVQRAGGYFFNSLSALTGGTAHFLLSFFILLYAMFFFFIGGAQTLDKIRRTCPCPRRTSIASPTGSCRSHVRRSRARWSSASSRAPSAARRSGPPGSKASRSGRC